MASYSASQFSGGGAGASTRRAPQPPAPRHSRAPSVGGLDLEQEMEQLERENFDLKMRLFYLEEKSAAGAGLPAQLYASLSHAGELSAALAQAQEEVESKNALLLKARGVIEALQNEAHTAHTQAAQERAQVQTEANERVQQAVLALETQLHAARAQTQEAHARRLQSEEEQASLRSVLSQQEHSLSHGAGEIASLSEQLHSLRLAAEERLSRATDAEQRLAALEAQVSTWQTEVNAREEAFKSTQEQLTLSMAQVEDMRPDRAKLEDASRRAHELELQLQATQAELARVQAEANHQLAAQQSHHDSLLQAHEQRLDESHSQALATRDEQARAAFAELQDAYAKQGAEAKLAHEAALAALRTDFEQRLAHAEEAAGARAAEEAQRFERELDTKARAFDLELQSLEARMVESQTRALEESARASEEELNGVKNAWRESEHSAAREIEGLKQEMALLRQQQAHGESQGARDAEQRERIHALQLQRLEERVAEATAAGAREIAELERRHEANLDASAAQLQKAIADAQAKETALLSSLDAQWAERESTLRAESAQHLAAAQAELEFVRANVVRVLRSQLDALEASLAREYAPLSRLEEAHAREVHAQEETRDVRARLGEKSAELDRLRSESVSVSKFNEVEDGLEKRERELQALQAHVQRLQQQQHRASPPPSHQQHGALSPILHVSMYPAQSHVGLSSPPVAHRTLSVSPPSTDAAAVYPLLPSPSSTSSDLRPALRKLQAENRSLQSHVATLRARLEEESVERENNLVPRVALLEAQGDLEEAERKLARKEAQVKQMRDLLVVARFPAGAAAASGAGAESMRELGAAAGISISSFSPPGSPAAASSHAMRRSAAHQSAAPLSAAEFLSSPDFGSTVAAAAAASSTHTGIAGNEELHAEVARLSRALKARSAELLAAQTALRQSKDSFRALQDSTIHRAVAAELESGLDRAARELGAREATVANLQAQVQRLEGDVARGEAQAQELRQQLHTLHGEAEEHVRSARAQCEATLAQEQAASQKQLEQFAAIAEEKSRLEQLVAAVAQQLTELCQATAFHPEEHAQLDQQQQAQVPASAARSSRHTPSRAHNSSVQRRGGLFSPALTHAQHTSAVLGIFSPATASSPFAAAFGSTPAGGFSSLPQSPPAASSSSTLQPLASAPHFASISASLQMLLSSSQAYQSRLEEVESALREGESDTQAARQNVARAEEAIKRAEEEIERLARALLVAEENAESRGRSLDAAAKAAEGTAREIQSLRASLAAATERAESTSKALRQAEESRARADQRAGDAESERSQLISVRLAHSALQQAHDAVVAAAAVDADERRTLLLQLENARALEAEHALLQQQLAQSEKRTQVVGADQQLLVQVTRRVLVELCEVLHAAKIPSSSSTDASAARTPSFLQGGTFHWPDDAEHAVKWIRAKVHELQRIRRAFEYTVLEVESKWKGNFSKLQSLLQTRQAEIAVLQRRLLTALGQKESVTGQLRWQ